MNQYLVKPAERRFRFAFENTGLTRLHFSPVSFKVGMFLLLVATGTAFPLTSHRIVVAKDGSGDFTTLTQAISSLPMFNYQRVVIFIKNGVYNEKVRITQDYVTLEGESRDSTIIEYDQLRTDWISHKDAIGPAVINIHADDVVLKNLTVENTQPQIGPHAFAVYDNGTRTIFLNCNLLSNGGDTVSPWNYKTGMYYFSNCTFRGSVDCVCPRGWCFIDHSRFDELKKGSTAIWHAGGFNINQKFVIENSTFDGVKGFELGRHHYEAQFYLLNCTFSKNMADTPIYRVTYKDSTKDRPFNWGERDYYYNCHRDGGNYSWFSNNLKSAAGSPSHASITPAWTFDNRWNPVSTKGPTVVKFEVEESRLLLFFKEPITVTGTPVLVSKNGSQFTYVDGAGSSTLRFESPSRISQGDLAGLTLGQGGKLFGTVASVQRRDVDLEKGI